MKLAIMQPYLFPYIGYFQLLNAVDEFVIYDDVNYIKRGWINRNKILLNNKPYNFTIALSKASAFKKINEIQIKFNSEKLNETIYHAYCNAPNFSKIFPMIKEIFNYKDDNLAKFVSNSLFVLKDYLNLQTKLTFSSELEKDNSLKGKDKIIAICKLLGADYYINSIGGKEFYSVDEFKNENIALNFLNSSVAEYEQFEKTFSPNLSIIDVLMFNSVDQINDMLNSYSLE